jgi:hypothetical protein
MYQSGRCIPNHNFDLKTNKFLHKTTASHVFCFLLLVFCCCFYYTVNWDILAVVLFWFIMKDSPVISRLSSRPMISTLSLPFFDSNGYEPTNSTKFEIDHMTLISTHNFRRKHKYLSCEYY